MNKTIKYENNYKICRVRLISLPQDQYKTEYKQFHCFASKDVSNHFSLQTFNDDQT